MPLVLAMLIGDLADDAVAHWLLAVFPPLRLPEFLLGVCLALLARRGVRSPVRLGGAAPLALIAVVVAGFVPEVYETLIGPPLAVSLLGALLTATAAAWALHAFVERPAELRLRPATRRASAERPVG